MTVKGKTPKKLKSTNYGKYGYYFILPFFIVYIVFSLWPLLSTFYYSFFEYITRNLKTTITWAGLNNYLNILGVGDEKAYFVKYLGNTLRIWAFNFLPQILLALLIAAWLTDSRVRMKGSGLYKVMVYMPNIITAASISLLFYALLSKFGPIISTLKDWGWIAADADIMTSKWGTSLTLSFILFWMWYGNSTLLLIAGMLGINPSLYEAADIDGANGFNKFFRVTLPLLKPVLLYVFITSVIGGLQLYDIPALFNTGTGGGLMGLPDDTSTTVAMYIMRLHSSDTGRASAVSVLLFIITLIISLAFFRVFRDSDDYKLAKKSRRIKKAEPTSGKGGAQ